jgi:hypothetical protein
MHAETKVIHTHGENAAVKISTAQEVIRLKAPSRPDILTVQRGQIGAWNFLWSRFANNGAKQERFCVRVPSMPLWRVWRFGMHGKLRSWSEQLFQPGITHELICLLRAINRIRANPVFKSTVFVCWEFCIVRALSWLHLCKCFQCFN